MVQLKTAKERLERKVEQRKRRDEIIMNRFKEYCKSYSISDAVTITANEFNLSVMTIYNIRRRTNK